MRIFAPSAKQVSRRTVENYRPSSHIESVPDEILMCVMQLAVSGPGLPRSSFSSALKLSHVSRRFRFIAHNTSELWIVICPKFPLVCDQVLFWSDVLARSRARLIDVVINAEVDLRGTIQPYATFLRAVVRHSNRWRKLEIMSKTWEPIDLFLGQSRRLFLLPRLEELTLHHSEDPGRTANRGYEDLTRRFHNILFGDDVVAPMFKIIKLGATYFDYSRMQSLAKDLTELHFENHTYPRTSDIPEIIIDVLRASSRLQVLTFTSLDVEFNHWPQPVELHHLRRLEFRGTPRSALNLLSLLRVPSLEILRLGECRFVADLETATALLAFAADTTITVLLGFFTSPAGTRWYWRAGGLMELSLEYTHCRAQGVERLLRLTLNVETLHMSSSAIFPILANNPEILPNLRHWVVKSSIFCPPHPFSAILSDRPGVTLSVEGDLTQDSEHLYNALKDTHNITLRV